MAFKHYSYPSINQYRQLIGQIRSQTQYVGKSEDGKPIFDENIPLPKVRATGTVKLHGTNAAVVLDSSRNLYTQSRNNVLSLEQDNMGFNSFVMKNKQYFEDMLSSYLTDGLEAVVVYGEWCGSNIQSGVAIASLPKMFVAFDIRLITSELEEGCGWVDACELDKWVNPELGVYNSQMFSCYELEIDVANPGLSQNTLIELTTQVENLCPVANYFGVEGVGEGIVWKVTTANGKRLAMKVVGEKHTKSKVTQLASVDCEKIKSINDFIAYAITENRLMQGFQTLSEGGKTLTKADMKSFMDWVFNDVLKEESETMVANGLNKRDISNKAAAEIRKWFILKI